MKDPIGRLVAGRAKKHLRMMGTATAAMIVLVAGVVLLLQAQAAELRRNVLANPNVHVVEVTYRSGGDGARQLRFVDVEEIARLTSNISEGADVIPRYVLPFGMTDASGAEYFIEGLAGDAGTLIGVSLDAPAVAAAADAPPALTLRVPHVSASAGGISSTRTSEFDFTTIAQPPGVPMDIFRPRDSAILTVGQRTFEDIVHIVFGREWDAFVREHDGTMNPFGVNVPQSVFVHVPETAEVVPVADELEAHGFDAAYTLRAFDDLAGTVDTAFVVTGATIAAITLGGAALIAASVVSYFRLARRDIGALKHFGYDAYRIRAVYRWRVARVLAVAASPAALLTLLVGVFAPLPRVDILLDLGGLALVLAVIYIVIDAIPLRVHVSSDVLTLLHRDREFD